MRLNTLWEAIRNIFITSESNRISDETVWFELLQLIPELPVSEWGNLDERLRIANSNTESSMLRKLSPDRLDSFNRFGPRRVMLLGIASSHANGFVREEAVRRLAMETSGEELPFLLLRTNDWVTQVREVAVRATEERLTFSYAAAWVRSLALVERMRGKSRRDSGPLVERIVELLSRPECRGVLKEGIVTADRKSRRMIVDMLMNANPVDIDVLESALHDSDSVVRYRATSRLAHLNDNDLAISLATATLSDGLGAIRRTVATIIGTRNPKRAIEHLWELLFDIDPGVRATVRGILSHQSDLDFLEVYRNAVDGGNERLLPGALAGLGEFGKPGDEVRMERFIHHSRSRVRQVATREFLRLAPSIDVAVLVDILGDPNYRVSREVALAPRRHRSMFTPDHLRKLFAATDDQRRQMNILRLTRHLPKWKLIIVLVEMLCGITTASNGSIEREIRRWQMNYNRSFAQPERGEIHQLRSALVRCGSLLPDRDRSQLIETIRLFPQ